MSQFQVLTVFGRPLQEWLAPHYGNNVLFACNIGVLWPNGWMDQDAIWYAGRPRPRQHCVRWLSATPTFGPCLLLPNGRPSQQLLSSC